MAGRPARDIALEENDFGLTVILGLLDNVIQSGVLIIDSRTRYTPCANHFHSEILSEMILFCLRRIRIEQLSTLKKRSRLRDDEAEKAGFNMGVIST